LFYDGKLAGITWNIHQWTFTTDAAVCCSQSNWTPAEHHERAIEQWH